jgi:hypothetical protein
VVIDMVATAGLYLPDGRRQTAIEPSAEWGDTYTSLTRAYADQWKRGGTAAQDGDPAQ